MKLCKYTDEITEKAVAEFKKLLTVACEQKSVAGLEVFSKSNLFDGVARLVEVGWFSEEADNTTAETLTSMLAFQKSMAKLVTLKSEDIEKFTEAERFAFAGELLNSKWLHGNLCAAFKDDAWCETINGTLKDLLPKLIGSADMKSKLTSSVKEKLEAIANAFKNSKSDLKSGDDDKTMVHKMAAVFSRKDFQWFSHDDIMDLI